MEGSSRRTALPKDNIGGEERTEGGARRTAIGKGGKRRDQAFYFCKVTFALVQRAVHTSFKGGSNGKE